MAMLRGSSEQQGRKVNLAAVTAKDGGEAGIPHGRLLTHFAEAVLGTDDQALDAARGRVQGELGDEALVDAAAVVATFATMDRMADSTGIPLEEEKARMTEGMRSQLGIDDYRNIPEPDAGDTSS